MNIRICFFLERERSIVMTAHAQVPNMRQEFERFLFNFIGIFFIFNTDFVVLSFYAVSCISMSFDVKKN